MSLVAAGLLTALYSLLASGTRIVGGLMADRLYQGGRNTGILALLVMLAGALVMTSAREYELAIPGIILLATGMGICNAAVFKILPQVVPQAVGGAAGWVGGLGAFGGLLFRRRWRSRSGTSGTAGTRSALSCSSSSRYSRSSWRGFSSSWSNRLGRRYRLPVTTAR